MLQRILKKKVVVITRISWNQCYIFYVGIADESTSHISQLVKRQKSTGHNTRIKTPKQEFKVVKPVIPSYLQEKIAVVLLNYPKGVEINTFNKSYIKRHGQKLEPHRLGFKTLKELLDNCVDILSITARRNDVFIYPKPGIVQYFYVCHVFMSHSLSCKHQEHQNGIAHVVLVFLLLTLKIFHTIV